MKESIPTAFRVWSLRLFASWKDTFCHMPATKKLSVFAEEIKRQGPPSVFDAFCYIPSVLTIERAKLVVGKQKNNYSTVTLRETISQNR